MKKKKKRDRRRRIILAACGVQLLAAVICFGLWQWLANLLPSQKEAERWQGEGELAFSQVSCFLPESGLIELQNIADARSQVMKAMDEASLDTKGPQQLMLDAWSTSSRLYTSGEHGRGEVSVIAVGGDYFDFHPIRLLSGNYLRQSDLMDDRILLSTEVAWLLFGGTDLAGMTMKLNGVPFMIAGVVEQETDFASREANSDGMDLYMSYDGLLRLQEEVKISCYECVLAEPVNGFAQRTMKEIFSDEKIEVICNTTRYQYGKLVDLMLRYGIRGARTTGAVLPYWESAARITENWAGLCCLAGTLLLIMPCVCACIWVVQSFRRVREKMESDTIPEVKERVEEGIRVRQRRRWERQHGEHEKK